MPVHSLLLYVRFVRTTTLQHPQEKDYYHHYIFLKSRDAFEQKLQNGTTTTTSFKQFLCY